MYHFAFDCRDFVRSVEIEMVAGCGCGNCGDRDSDGQGLKVVAGVQCFGVRGWVLLLGFGGFCEI